MMMAKVMEGIAIKEKKKHNIGSLPFLSTIPRDEGVLFKKKLSKEASFFVYKG